jgi:hypothetical protein
MERWKILAVAAVVAWTLAAGSALAADPPAGPQIVEERIGPCDTRDVRISPDGLHTVYAQRRGDAVRIVYDGRDGPEFTAPPVAGQRFDIFVHLSPDGNRTFASVDTPDGVIPVLDGQPGPVHAKLGMPLFSRDGRRLAYQAMDHGPDGAAEWRVVLDGRPGPAYDKIDALQFSPDGGRVSYSATKGKEAFAVIDGKPGPAYEEINALQFSPDGRRTAYKGKVGEKYAAVIDGKAEPLHSPRDMYDLNLTFYWSPDSQHIAYEACQGGRTRMVVDGKDGPEYDYMAEIGFSERHRGCVFSQDSQHFAYGATFALPEGPRSFVVLDGKVVGKGYDRSSFGGLQFVANRLVYMADRGGKRLVCFDGAEGMEYDQVTPWRLVGADRKSIVHEGRRDGEWYVVTDGRERPAPADFAPPGPPRRDDILAGAHTASVSRAAGTAVVVLDGKPGDAYEAVGGVSLADDGHIAYPAKRQNLWRIVIDGREGPPCDEIGACTLGQGGRLAYAARFGAKWRIVADGKPGPEFDAIMHMPRYLPCVAGREWVYVAKRGESKVLVVGEQVFPPAKEVWFVEPPKTWPYDGPPHWAARVVHEGRADLVYDGKTAVSYDAELWQPRFLPDGGLQSFGLRDGALYRTTIKPGPAK